MRIIFFVILVDLIGFGIMIPLLPNFADELSGSTGLATLVVGLYAAGMLFSTTVMGRLSDFYGRRPVLLLSMAGATLGYVALSFSTTITMVAAARLFSGLMAGNISTAQAYITDITTPENRAKGMGMIGAAFGLGFIIGPTIGSLMSGDDFKAISLATAGLTSAALSGLAFLTILFKLPESLSKEQRDALRHEKRISQFKALGQVMTRPVILAMLVSILIYNTAAGMAETILPIWTKKIGVIQSPDELFHYLLPAGLMLAIVQGGLVGPIQKRIGEYKMVFTGLSLFAVALVAMGYFGSQGSKLGTIVSLCFQSCGAGLFMPALQSLVSQRAGDTERGMVMGLYSSFGMLGRTIGTIGTGFVMSNIYIHAPYYGGALLAIFLILMISFLNNRMANKPAA
ncbi:MFS transporter [Temperatibacter marinus]|uniref:MFS transporter n=1 Tax=Temperatibacter marinus TaxID=1456591 RepID=UPI0035C6EB42